MNRINYLVVFFLIMAALIFTMPGHAGDKNSPKALFEEACSQCHSIGVPKAERMSKPDWQSIVSRMRSNGCSITDKEAAIIVDYLAENYGKKN